MPDASPDGGMGENPVLAESEARHLRAEIRLLNRAVRQRWDIPDSVRKAVPAAMLKIVETEMVAVALDGGGTAVVSNARAQTAAAKVLVAMEAQNQTDDHATAKGAGELTEKHEHHHEIEGRFSEEQRLTLAVQYEHLIPLLPAVLQERARAMLEERRDGGS